MWLTIMSNVIAFTDADTNPCMQCGACCAYFRVSFYHGETDSTGGVVPAEMTEKVNDFMACMKGTDQKSPRCINLQGEVGQCVACSAYAQRPSPCREFDQSWVSGVHNAACDRARAAHGLPPLKPPSRHNDHAA